MSLPIDRMVRGSDPATSLWAAQDAIRASRAACIATADLMNDGVARIDEEIWQGCRDNHFKKTLSTIQHARLVLSEAGLLVFTGVTRPTSNGSLSQEWMRADGRDLSAIVRDMPKKLPPKKSKTQAADDAPPHCSTCTCGKTHVAAPPIQTELPLTPTMEPATT